jgi:hypothetical protein
MSVDPAETQGQGASGSCHGAVLPQRIELVQGIFVGKCGKMRAVAIHGMPETSTHACSAISGPNPPPNTNIYIIFFLKLVAMHHQLPTFTVHGYRMYAGGTQGLATRMVALTSSHSKRIPWQNQDRPHSPG